MADNTFDTPKPTIERPSIQAIDIADQYFSHVQSNRSTNRKVEKIAEEKIVKVKVIGVGGAGNNTITKLYEYGVEGVELVAINTDVQALNMTKADVRIAVGASVTGGLGAGFDPMVGKNAFLESKAEIEEMLRDADLVIVIGGLGGGTGTGIAPEICKLAREMGILSTSISYLPFEFEGLYRSRNAQEGLKEIRDNADSFFVIDNNDILARSSDEVSFEEALDLINTTICNFLHELINLIFETGFVNVDFADISRVLHDKEEGFFATCTITEPAELSKILVVDSILRAELRTLETAIINVKIGGKNSLNKVAEVQEVIREIVESNLEIVVGVRIDSQDQTDELSVTVIAV